MTRFAQKDTGSEFDQSVDVDMGYQTMDTLTPALKDVVVALFEMDVPREAIDQAVEVAAGIVQSRRARIEAEHPELDLSSG